MSRTFRRKNSHEERRYVGRYQVVDGVMLVWVAYCASWARPLDKHVRFKNPEKQSAFERARYHTDKRYGWHLRKVERKILQKSLRGKEDWRGPPFKGK